MFENKKLIIANWKMNGNLEICINLVQKIGKINKNKEVIICPSYPMIPILKTYSNHFIKFGAQDCSEHQAGAFTGEVSADMLADIGCKYVIIGHSERRIYHNEKIKIINNKIELASKAGLKIIICIGEDINSRTDGSYLNYIENQIKQLDIKDKEQQNIIIAYEPIWAIGNNKPATIEQIEEMLNFISESIENKFKIIYGGSVDENNIDEILNINLCAGALIGNASINLEKFKKIIT